MHRLLSRSSRLISSWSVFRATVWSILWLEVVGGEEVVLAAVSERDAQEEQHGRWDDHPRTRETCSVGIPNNYTMRDTAGTRACHALGTRNARHALSSSRARAF